MAGFLFAELANTQITTATTTNLFTVTSGHSFLIKYFYIAHDESATSTTTAKTFIIELSDTGGSNFTQVFPNLVTAATVAVHTIQLASDSGLANGATSVSRTLQDLSGTTNIITENLYNTPLKAGQVLRLISSGTYASGDSTQIIINGIDHTE